MFQASSTSSLTHKLASLGLGSKEKEHKRTFSLPGRSGGKEKAKEAGRTRGDRASRDTINHTESGEERTEDSELVRITCFRGLWPGLGGLSPAV